MVITQHFAVCRKPCNICMGRVINKIKISQQTDPFLLLKIYTYTLSFHCIIWNHPHNKHTIKPLRRTLLGNEILIRPNYIFIFDVTPVSLISPRQYTITLLLVMLIMHTVLHCCFLLGIKSPLLLLLLTDSEPYSHTCYHLPIHSAQKRL